MAMQRAAASLVGIDVQVNPFMAHAWLFRPLQMPGDLFRTPVLAQESLDLLPRLPGNTRTIGVTLPAVSQFIRLIVAIALDRKSTRLNSSHQIISYAVFSFKKKNR